MKLGFIGAGRIGQGLARLAVGGSHGVMLSNSRAPQTLTDLAAAIGGTAGTTTETVAFADVVVLTIPFKNIFSLDRSLLAGKIVIDTNNYYPDRDGRIADLDEFRTTTSQMLAAHFTGARVVKAFNAILAADLSPQVMDKLDRESGKRRALPIAGDDPAAKRVVAQLQQEFGFDVLDAGALADSWRFERAKPGYCIPLDKAGLQSALASAERTVELPHGSWHR